MSSVSSANTDISVASGTTTPVLTLNSGVGANKLVKQDSAGKLPAVDGSQLTGLTLAQAAGDTTHRTVTDTQLSKINNIEPVGIQVVTSAEYTALGTAVNTNNVLYVIAG